MYSMSSGALRDGCMESLREVSLWIFVHVARKPHTYVLTSACNIRVCEWASTVFYVWNENVVYMIK